MSMYKTSDALGGLLMSATFRMLLAGNTVTAVAAVTIEVALPTTGVLRTAKGGGSADIFMCSGNGVSYQKLGGAAHFHAQVITTPPPAQRDACDPRRWRSMSGKSSRPH